MFFVVHLLQYVLDGITTSDVSYGCTSSEVEVFLLVYVVDSFLIERSRFSISLISATAICCYCEDSSI